MYSLSVIVIEVLAPLAYGLQVLHLEIGGVDPPVLLRHGVADPLDVSVDVGSQRRIAVGDPYDRPVGLGGVEADPLGQLRGMLRRGGRPVDGRQQRRGILQLHVRARHCSGESGVVVFDCAVSEAAGGKPLVECRLNSYVMNDWSEIEGAAAARAGTPDDD